MIIAMDERDEGLPVVDPTQVDASLHGASHAKAQGDGTFERVDPASVRPIRPGEPGYDDEHGNQGKQEDRLADSEVERLTEQLADFQAVVRAREERVSMLTDRLRERGLTVPDEITDAERGRAFLERLRDRHADAEWVLAGDVLHDVLELRKAPADIDSGFLAALGRVLREAT